MVTKEKLSKVLRAARIYLFVAFVAIMFLRPLYMANFWIENQPFREIANAQWKDFRCGTRFDQQFVDLGTIFPNYTAGGKYHNNDCPSAQKIAIIVPYRNRTEHLYAFLDHMHHFLITQNAVHYQIFIVEQVDNYPFNRGTLMNVGFQEASRADPETNCFIFHDVDLLPSDFRQHYTCSEYPRHLCSYIDTLRYVIIYKNIFGGAISLQKKHFTDVNGFSNKYFGWGGEDDDMFKRINSQHSTIERYDSEVGRCRMLKHSHNQQESVDRMDILGNALSRMPKDGLSDLRKIYSYLGIQHHKLYTKVKVKLRYNH